MNASATATASWPGPATASPARRVHFVPMHEDALDAIQAVETTAYAHPWSRRHFHDSLRSGYPAVMLLGEHLPGDVGPPAVPGGEVLIGYLVAMPGVDEVHLLNITVAPVHQHQGWARLMLDALVTWSRGQAANTLWLEVRQSNAPARRLYERYGFRQVGVRRGYYPVSSFEREDAIVMSLGIGGQP